MGSSTAPTLSEAPIAAASPKSPTSLPASSSSTPSPPACQPRKRRIVGLSRSNVASMSKARKQTADQTPSSSSGSGGGDDPRDTRTMPDISSFTRGSLLLDSGDDDVKQMAGSSKHGSKFKAPMSKTISCTLSKWFVRTLTYVTSVLMQER